MYRALHTHFSRESRSQASTDLMKPSIFKMMVLLYSFGASVISTMYCKIEVDIVYLRGDIHRLLRHDIEAGFEPVPRYAIHS